MDFNGRQLISSTLTTSQVVWTSVEDEWGWFREAGGTDSERRWKGERRSDSVLDWLTDRLFNYFVYYLSSHLSIHKLTLYIHTYKYTFITDMCIYCMYIHTMLSNKNFWLTRFDIFVFPPSLMLSHSVTTSLCMSLSDSLSVCFTVCC